MEDFFNYIKEHGLDILNNNDRAKAVASDLIKDQNEMNTIKQCIEQNIFIDIYQVKDCTKVEIIGVICKLMHKMLNDMVFSLTMTTNIINRTLVLFSIQIDKQQLMESFYRSTFEGFEYMNGFDYKKEYLYINELILSRFPEHSLGKMMAIDFGNYALLNADYTLKEGEFRWLVRNCNMFLENIHFYDGCRIDKYRSVITQYLSAQMKLLEGRLGEAFYGFEELNAYIKNHVDAVTRDGRLVHLWFNSRMIMHIIKNILKIADKNFRESNKAIYTLMTTKNLSNSDLWFDINNAEQIPLLEINGNPNKSSLFDDSSHWKAPVNCELQFSGDSMKIKRIGMHYAVEDVVKIKCDDMNKNHILKHVWDDAAEDTEKGGGYLIKCLQNSSVKDYLWN